MFPSQAAPAAWPLPAFSQSKAMNLYEACLTLLRVYSRNNVGRQRADAPAEEEEQYQDLLLIMELLTNLLSKEFIDFSDTGRCARARPLGLRLLPSERSSACGMWRPTRRSHLPNRRKPAGPRGRGPGGTNSPVPGLPLVEMKVLVSSLSQAPSQCRALSLSRQRESGATGARVLEARKRAQEFTPPACRCAARAPQRLTSEASVRARFTDEFPLRVLWGSPSPVPTAAWEPLDLGADRRHSKALTWGSPAAWPCGVCCLPRPPLLLQGLWRSVPAKLCSRCAGRYLWCLPLPLSSPLLSQAGVSGCPEPRVSAALLHHLLPTACLASGHRGRQLHGEDVLSTCPAPGWAAPGQWVLLPLPPPTPSRPLCSAHLTLDVFFSVPSTGSLSRGFWQSCPVPGTVSFGPGALLPWAADRAPGEARPLPLFPGPATRAGVGPRLSDSFRPGLLHLF